MAFYSDLHLICMIDALLGFDVPSLKHEYLNASVALRLMHDAMHTLRRNGMGNYNVINMTRLNGYIVLGGRWENKKVRCHFENIKLIIDLH